MSPHSHTTRRSRWRPTAARRHEAHGFGGRREAHGLSVLAVHPAGLAALLGVGARLTVREIGPGCKSLHPNPSKVAVFVLSAPQKVRARRRGMVVRGVREPKHLCCIATTVQDTREGYCGELLPWIAR